MACGGKKTVIPEWVTGKPIDPSGKFVYVLGLRLDRVDVAQGKACRLP